MTHHCKNNTSLRKPVINKDNYVMGVKFCNANAIVHKLCICKGRGGARILEFLGIWTKTELFAVPLISDVTFEEKKPLNIVILLSVENMDSSFSQENFIFLNKSERSSDPGNVS